MSGPVDVRGILERAGADAAAPEGSQAWALAQVGEAVAELLAAASDMQRLAKGPAGGVSQSEKRATVVRMDRALARFPGGPA